MDLLDEIVDLTVKSDQPISDLLRKCLMLAYQLKNQRFTSMIANSGSEHEGRLAGARQPPMNSATSFRFVELSPHKMLDAMTATEDLFVLAPLGVPRVDPERWSLTIDGLVGRSLTLTLADLKGPPDLFLLMPRASILTTDGTEKGPEDLQRADRALPTA